jgi:hypothetical protein
MAKRVSPPSFRQKMLHSISPANNLVCGGAGAGPTWVGQSATQINVCPRDLLCCGVHLPDSFDR